MATVHAAYVNLMVYSTEYILLRKRRYTSVLVFLCQFAVQVYHENELYTIPIHNYAFQSSYQIVIGRRSGWGRGRERGRAVPISLAEKREMCTITPEISQKVRRIVVTLATRLAASAFENKLSYGLSYPESRPVGIKYDKGEQDGRGPF